jgi:hypothetical protein
MKTTLGPSVTASTYVSVGKDFALAHTVGCKSFPDFVEPVGESPVNSYNRPYDEEMLHSRSAPNTVQRHLDNR